MLAFAWMARLSWLFENMGYCAESVLLSRLKTCFGELDDFGWCHHISTLGMMKDQPKRCFWTPSFLTIYILNACGWVAWKIRISLADIPKWMTDSFLDHRNSNKRGSDSRPSLLPKELGYQEHSVWHKVARMNGHISGTNMVNERRQLKAFAWRRMCFFMLVMENCMQASLASKGLSNVDAGRDCWWIASRLRPWGTRKKPCGSVWCGTRLGQQGKRCGVWRMARIDV